MTLLGLFLTAAMATAPVPAQAAAPGSVPAPASASASVSVSGPASVQSATAAEPRPITLQEALELAQRNAPAIVQAMGQKRTTAAGVRSAYAAFLPTVSLSAGATRQLQSGPGRTRVENGQIITLPSDPWSYSQGLGANLQLFDGGQRFFDLRQAQANARSAAASEVSQRFAATLAVKQQFFNVLAAREYGAAAQAQLEQAQQQLKASVLRVRARTATRSDSLRSEIQVRSARIAILDARISLQVANAALTRAVATPDPVTAANTDLGEPAQLTLSDDALRELALEGPGVRQAQEQLAAAQQARRRAWTAYLPSVSASYSRSGNATGGAFALTGNDYSYSSTVRFSLSFPLFNGLQREQQVVQAQVAQENAEATLRDAQLGALESLAQSLGGFRSAEEKVASQAASVEAAEEDLRVQQQRYGVSAATLLDILTSQALLDQARQDLIRARFDLRVARAQLEALVGREL